MEKLKKTRVVVTGGAGFIGSHIVDLLIDAGAQVTVIDRRRKDEAVRLAHCMDQIAYVESDIRDYRGMCEIFEGHTYLIHQAAEVSVPKSIEDPIGTYDVNVSGTLSVFEAAAQAGVQRVVYASSAAVYGDPQSFPISEDVPLVPLSPYGLHKKLNEILAEYYASQGEMRMVGLRYFNVFGPRQDPHSPYSGVVSIFADKVRSGSSPIIYGDGGTTRDFVHVEDVAWVNVAALCADTEGSVVCNIGSGTETTITELFEAIARVYGGGVRPEYRPAREGDIRRSCASIRNAKLLFSYKPTKSLEDGLRDLLNT